MSADKLRKRITKHAAWLLIAMLTGGAWVFYFGDAPTLAIDLVTGNAPYVAYTTVAILTASTYLLGGLAREQVCTYMCPWPRIQGAMIDDQSLMVSYRAWRGDPRGHHRKGDSWENRGDCIDCKQCVVVCPMGIDIRDGAQLECINCALCIDACNEVMTKIERPPNLIAYDSFRGLETAGQGDTRPSLIRPRTIIYVALIGLVSLVMLAALLLRSDFDMSVQRDRNPLFVRLSDGSIRNGYTVHVLNKTYGETNFALSVQGLPGAVISILGQSDSSVDLLPDDLVRIRVFLTAPASAAMSAKKRSGVSVPIKIVAARIDGSIAVSSGTTFRIPEEK